LIDGLTDATGHQSPTSAAQFNDANRSHQAAAWGVAEFKSTRRRKSKSRSPLRDNSSESQFVFLNEVTTDFGKSKIVRKAMQSFFSC